MDMTTTSMAMAMATSAATSPMSSTTATASGASTSGMAMGGSSKCKISMLWNWYTVDACFLASTWHITSNGMFAGSCIGVVGLVVLLEFLRRLQREFDRSIQTPQHSSSSSTGSTNDDDARPSKVNSNDRPLHLLLGNNSKQYIGRPSTRHVLTLRQQVVRAVIHTMQFAVAYIVMLLAMYYNGFIIVCIFIGVFIGFMIFAWDHDGGTSRSSSAENAACCA